MRGKAKQKSNKSAAYMVQQNIKKNPPSTYQVGEHVFLRVRAKGGVKQGGHPMHKKLVHRAQIADVNHDTFRYKVKYIDNNKDITETVPVNDITSTTRAEEQKRQEARKKFKQKMCLCADDHCRHKPSENCKFNMNAMCCRKQAKKCRFHGVETLNKTPSQPSKDAQNVLTHRYNVSSPDIFIKLCKDFLTDGDGETQEMTTPPTGIGELLQQYVALVNRLLYILPPIWKTCLPATRCLPGHRTR